MADNVGYTAGSGTLIATREVPYSGDTTNMQVVALASVTGPNDAKTATDVSETAPLPVAVYGELLEAIEAMRMAVNALTKSIGYALPNSQGFPIMEVRQSSAAVLNANISTCSLLTNQSQIGGAAANDQIPALMHLQADGLRRNIGVS